MIRCALLLACLVLALAGSAVAKVPEGFEDSRIAGFDGAMALAFTPDGRLLIAGRTGHLHVFRNGKLMPQPALDIKDRVCWNAERGMTGVAVDPRFAANGHIYLYYTYDKHHTGSEGSCPAKTRNTPVNRVSRFTLGSDNVVDPASERVLLDNIPSYSGNHNAGDLGFGHDGYLYVSVGDGGCDYTGNSGCYDKNDAARDQNVLLGKVLRITRTGGIPPDNPFLGPNSARCGLKGRTEPGMRCRETYAWGLRNPFRFDFDPAARGTRLFINDTGEQGFEEVNLGRPGADYGWNLREGPCRKNDKAVCGRPPRGMTNPVFAYAHRDGCGAISGGAFVPPGAWTERYRGGYLFGDYKCGEIRLLQSGSRHAIDFASREGPVIDLVFGPDDDGAPGPLLHDVEHESQRLGRAQDHDSGR